MTFNQYLKEHYTKLQINLLYTTDEGQEELEEAKEQWKEEEGN